MMYFLSFQDALNILWEETLAAASRGPPSVKMRMWVRRSFPVRRDDNPAHQSFNEALFGWSWVLKNSGESLPLTKERGYQLTVSVIYFHLFKHFYLNKCRFLILFYNINKLNFSTTEQYFKDHKLLPVHQTWLHQVYGKMFYFARPLF